MTSVTVRWNATEANGAPFLPDIRTTVLDGFLSDQPDQGARVAEAVIEDYFSTEEEDWEGEPITLNVHIQEPWEISGQYETRVVLIVKATAVKRR